jgi:hypothetical protein
MRFYRKQHVLKLLYKIERRVQAKRWTIEEDVLVSFSIGFRI